MSTRKMLLGLRIKELRKRAGLSQDQLAEKVGIEAKYLSRIEVGKRYPSLETLENIADSLEVEMKELFDYFHHDSAETSPQEIENLTHKATKEELKLIHKLIRAVLR
jgi:transcriptional regulator with XRE-family HTH domain